MRSLGGGKYAIYASTEIKLFDYAKSFNLVSPYIVVSRKGTLTFDLMGAYARTFQEGSNVWVGRLGIGKNLFNGYSCKVYAWAVNWGAVNYSMVGELSKELTPNMRLALYYHLNNFTSEKKQEFGAVRVSYSF